MDKLKQNKLIIKKLQSNDVEEVLFTIKELRNTGDKDLIPYVIDLLAEHKSERVKKAVLNLLIDLKHQNVVPVIIDALQSDKYFNIKEQLLNVCWQSRLDFSEYMPVFIDYFIQGDFNQSFEAFTVIENMESKIDKIMAESAIANLKNELGNISENKKELLVELVHIIENKDTK